MAVKWKEARAIRFAQTREGGDKETGMTHESEEVEM